MVPPIPVRLTPESLQGILEVVAWIVDSAESDPNPTLGKGFIVIIVFITKSLLMNCFYLQKILRS